MFPLKKGKTASQAHVGLLTGTIPQKVGDKNRIRRSFRNWRLARNEFDVTNLVDCCLPPPVP